MAIQPNQYKEQTGKVADALTAVGKYFVPSNFLKLDKATQRTALEALKPYVPNLNIDSLLNYPDQSRLSQFLNPTIMGLFGEGARDLYIMQQSGQDMTAAIKKYEGLLGATSGITGVAYTPLESILSGTQPTSQPTNYKPEENVVTGSDLPVYQTPATVQAAATPAIAPADAKVQIKDVNGNMITVYQSSIPALIAEGTLSKGTTGTPMVVSATTPTSTPTYTIPFKNGLTENQKTSIYTLMNKPTNEWNDTDKANWNWATNNAPLGQYVNTTPEGGTLISGSTSIPATSNIPFINGLTDTQKQSIITLSTKPADQWTTTDKTNWSWATNNSSIPSVSTPTTVTPIISVDQNNISESLIPFREGLTDTQKQSIVTLSTKSADQWNDTDKANWKWATNNAALPITEQIPKLPETLQNKLYDAFGRFPTDEDIKNYQYNSALFERQLDDAITVKNKKQTDETTQIAEQQKIDEELKKQATDSADSDALKTIYGTTKQPLNVEQKAANLIGQIFTAIKNKGGIIEDTFKNNILNNPTQLAKYTSALLYGGYTIDDVYRDLKMKELAAQGITDYQGKSGFSETISATEWYNTPEGQSSKNNPVLVPPTDTMEISAELFNNPIFAIPAAVFSTLVEPLDKNSPEFKAEAEKIQASYYDIMTQKAQAETEQQKAVANESYNLFKDKLNKTYGIQLSDNANAAWGQLNNLFSGASEKGLGSSGLLTEATNKYLADIRKKDQRLRDEKATTATTEEINQLLKSGSSADIQAYIAKNGVERAKALGLVPSDEVANWYSVSNLKTLYPNMSDTEIANIRNMMLDENGNYRSNIYQTMYGNQYDLGQQKKTYQEGKLEEQKLAEEKKAYAPFTQTNPFVDLGINETGTNTGTQSATLNYTLPNTGTSDTSKWGVAQTGTSDSSQWNVAKSDYTAPQITTPDFESRTQKVKNKITGEVITVEKSSDWWKNDYQLA